MPVLKNKKQNMIKVKKHGIILKPTKHPFESKCVFNPGIYQEGDNVHILYRALDDNYMSSFGYAKLKGPTKVLERWKEPFMKAKYAYEKKGIEDPRITKIGETFYVVYVAHDGKNALAAYLYGKDLFKLKHGGIISPTMSYRKASKLFQFSKLKDDYYFFSSFYEKYAGKNVMIWEKDAMFFPEKIRGKYALLHRVLPDIQISRADTFRMYKDKDFWHNQIHHIGKHVVMEGRQGWEARHIGAGAPPIKTKKGWLIIYHGVEPRNEGRVYHAGAALLDLRDPKKTVGRLPYPLFSPEEKYEREGHVNDVVFPTGTAIFKDRLYIYYGTSDTYVAVASVNLNNLIKELLLHPEK
jgi:beta-1,2-mannobiose phosphorylase / 1,2-beta-oligomannan phosphorylase